MRYVLVPPGITRLVRSCSESRLHVSDYLTLGDGTIMVHCLHTFSQIYQGLSQEFADPTFQKYHFPTPPRSVVAEFWPRMPYNHASHQMSGSEYAEYLGSHRNFGYLRWRIDSHDLRELRSVAPSKRQDNRSPSRQDCLIAYLVTILNQNRSTPLQKVTNMITVNQSISLMLRVLTCFQCRGVLTSFFDQDAASCFLVYVRVFHPLLR